MLTVKSDEKGEVEDTQIKGIGVKNERNNSLRNQKGNWIGNVYGVHFIQDWVTQLPKDIKEF